MNYARKISFQGEAMQVWESGCLTFIVNIDREKWKRWRPKLKPMLPAGWKMYMDGRGDAEYCRVTCASIDAYPAMSREWVEMFKAKLLLTVKA